MLASNLWYPGGTLNKAASCAPSLMLVNSLVMPLSDTVLIGKCSFWSTQRVSFSPFFSVISHLSQARPLRVSVPSFLQVAPSLTEQGSPLKVWNLGIRCVKGLFWSMGNSMYI